MFNSFAFPEVVLQLLNHIYIVTVWSIAVLIVLENRNPVKTMSWVLVLILLPYAGLILYIFFGQNYRRQKIITRKSIKQIELINGYYDILKNKFSIKKILLPPDLEKHRKLISLLFSNNHTLFTDNNTIRILNNGTEKFPELLNDIQKAKSFIHLEYYIFDDDNIGNTIIQALFEKIKEGVEVRMIVDDVGSWHLKRRFFKKLRAGGIEVYPFLKVRFPFFTSKINYRNHRKIVVIDGHTGYTGGLNVADRYVHGVKKLGSWRDIHVKIEGDAVSSLQSIFILDWYFVSRQRIRDSKYFPENTHEKQDNLRMQIAWSSPDSDWKTIEQAFFTAITGAEKYLYIESPYFLPTESILMGLKTAALSGTDVRLIVPGKSDAFITEASSHSYLREIMEAGVRVFFYQNGFLHSKLLITDDTLTSVGSANMDFRSFEDNFEVTAFIYDPETTAVAKQNFMNDLASSHEITLEEWKKRNRFRKFIESLARLFSPLL
ncbi:cardiolipin synthase [Saccharicrinis sp. FJH54]|uniref:cardiolipin synthase n=1 Tax=Saccharicrinis sp. FJH54 TaxID=3344665 RepID=UPI0035D431CB